MLWQQFFICLLCASLQRSARTAAEESDAIFTELIRSIELKRFEVRELIKAQEKTAVSQAEQVLEKIQKEIAELKKNEAELDKLSHTEDHVHFLQVGTAQIDARRAYSFLNSYTVTHLTLSLSLQSCQSLQAPPALSVMPSVSNLSFGPVMTAVADFKGLLQEVCQGGFVCIYEKGRSHELNQITELFCQLLLMSFFSFAVRDVVIVGPPNPAAQLNTTQPSDGEAAVQMEATQGESFSSSKYDLEESVTRLQPLLQNL